MKIGFIGLGMMGRPMAERLIEQGFDLKVNDQNVALESEFGERWASSPANAAQDVDLLITMLPTGHVVRDVLVGAGNAAASLKAGAIVLDASSSDAAGTVDLGSELARRNILLVDAPVSGGVVLAREGKLAIMTGCPDDALFERIEPVLQALSARLTRVGKLGAGHAAKAINNAVAAAIFCATSEGMTMGERFGIDPELLLEVINGSSGRSNVSEGVFRSQILPKSYAQGFSIALMSKDVGLANDLRRELKLELPVLERAEQLWKAALADLGPTADFTAYHLFAEKNAGG